MKIPRQLAKGGNAMTRSYHTFQGIKSRHPKMTSIETSLYDLIEAMNEEIRAGEDGLIVQAVVHLVDTGTLKFIGIPKEFNALYA